MFDTGLVYAQFASNIQVNYQASGISALLEGMSKRFSSGIEQDGAAFLRIKRNRKRFPFLEGERVLSFFFRLTPSEHGCRHAAKDRGMRILGKALFSPIDHVLRSPEEEQNRPFNETTCSVFTSDYTPLLQA